MGETTGKEKNEEKPVPDDVTRNVLRIQELLGKHVDLLKREHLVLYAETLHIPALVEAIRELDTISPQSDLAKGKEGNLEHYRSITAFYLLEPAERREIIQCLRRILTVGIHTIPTIHNITVFIDLLRLFEDSRHESALAARKSSEHLFDAEGMPSGKENLIGETPTDEL